MLTWQKSVGRLIWWLMITATKTAQPGALKQIAVLGSSQHAYSVALQLRREGHAVHHFPDGSQDPLTRVLSPEINELSFHILYQDIDCIEAGPRSFASTQLRKNLAGLAKSFAFGRTDFFGPYARGPLDLGWATKHSLATTAPQRLYVWKHSDLIEKLKQNNVQIGVVYPSNGQSVLSLRLPTNGKKKSAECVFNAPFPPMTFDRIMICDDHLAVSCDGSTELLSVLAPLPTDAVWKTFGCQVDSRSTTHLPLVSVLLSDTPDQNRSLGQTGVISTGSLKIVLCVPSGSKSSWVQIRSLEILNNDPWGEEITNNHHLKNLTKELGLPMSLDGLMELPVHPNDLVYRNAPPTQTTNVVVRTRAPKVISSEPVAHSLNLV